MISQTEKQNIINLCKNENFSNISFANFQLLEDEISNYKKWLELEYNADMKWMTNNIDKRENISLVLNNTKSVITLAYNYNQNVVRKSGNNKISQYAWGDDYHNYIPKKLKRICKVLSENYPKEDFLYYIDTGPILEKQWAVKSGLGWQGKNSLILNRHLGSYFFIAIIITTLEIESDELIQDYCGKCTKCIDACPTNAIVQDKVVDSNKCISYWTIESKDEKFPKDIEENLNGWAFGCDICQEVCPWNNHRVPVQIEEFVEPRDGNSEFEAKMILDFSEEEFRNYYIKSPIKRPKHKGIKRNILSNDK